MANKRASNRNGPSGNSDTSGTANANRHPPPPQRFALVRWLSGSQKGTFTVNVDWISDLDNHYSDVPSATLLNARNHRSHKRGGPCLMLKFQKLAVSANVTSLIQQILPLITRSLGGVTNLGGSKLGQAGVEKCRWNMGTWKHKGCLKLLSALKAPLAPSCLCLCAMSTLNAVVYQLKWTLRLLLKRTGLMVLCHVQSRSRAKSIIKSNIWKLISN